MYGDLGKRIKLVRVAAGLRQRELAEEAGVSQSMIAKIEAGRSKRPKGEVLMKLAKALSIDEALFIENDQLEERREIESLQEMLVESGMSKEAAEIIVRYLRKSALSELRGALKK